ncbi:MAG: HEAT repeat domain-containing protein [Chromatiaceae bacterium]|nr:HEAT repeat domain-containing protein [Chromatiaceae bacterium]
MGLKKPPTQTAATQDERRLPRDFKGLCQALEDDSPKARRWAARDLAAFPEASAALLARLGREPDHSVREVILTSLTRLGDATALAGLIDCLRSEDALLRNDAIEALQQLPEEVAPHMERLLADPDSDMRIFAVNVLQSLRHPQVEPWLIAVIEHDPHVNVCAAAVDLLGEVGTAAARAPLRALKKRFAEEPYIRFATDLALKRVGEG